MLSVHNLACQRGGRELFSGINFELNPGELLYIRGANGTGKTTLLRSVCGLTQPENGEIHWNKQGITSQATEFHQQLCYLGHRNGLHPELSPFENLLTDADLHPSSSDADISAAIDAAGIKEKTDVPVKYLSQGQQRRVALSKCLVRNSKLWVLDEPFTALDDKAIDWFVSVIAMHLENSGMVLLTTHQETAVNAHVTREVMLVTETML